MRSYVENFPLMTLFCMKKKYKNSIGGELVMTPKQVRTYEPGSLTILIATSLILMAIAFIMYGFSIVNFLILVAVILTMRFYPKVLTAATFSTNRRGCHCNSRKFSELSDAIIVTDIRKSDEVWVFNKAKHSRTLVWKGADSQEQKIVTEALSKFIKNRVTLPIETL